MAILSVAFSAPIDAQKRSKGTSKRATTTKSAKPDRDADLSADELFDKACKAIEADDTAKIVKYLTLAAEKGHPQAMTAVGEALAVEGYYGLRSFTDKNGNGTKKINPGILRPNGLDRKKGREYLLKVYELAKNGTYPGHEHWMLELSTYYLANSYSDTGEYETALPYAKEAVEHSSPTSNSYYTRLNLVGVIYRYGFDDYDNAITWYRKAAESGEAQHQRNLGETYLQKDNDAQAAMWFHKAAKQDDSFSLYKLGLLYSFGMGVEKDEERAFKYMKKAAELDEVGAYMFLGWWYLEGVGCKPSKKRAIQWLTKAKENFDRYDSDDQDRIDDLLERADAD